MLGCFGLPLAQACIGYHKTWRSVCTPSSKFSTYSEAKTYVQ